MPKKPRELASANSARREAPTASVIGGISVGQAGEHLSEKLRTKYSSYAEAKQEANKPSAPSTPPPMPYPEPDPEPSQLEAIDLDTGAITFSGGVPVGGNAHLSLFPNGAYSSTGHFHDSGATSHNMELVWAVWSNNGKMFVFPHTGRVHGTFEEGSRNDDWGNSGTNPAIAAAWQDLSAGYSARWTAGANLDIDGMIDQLIKTAGKAAAAVAIVA